MTDRAAALAEVRARIARAERSSGRPAGSVGLLAVSKGWPAEAIRTMAAAGQRRFGESYVGEALPKIEALADLGLEWHFIGPIQSNKTRAIAERFDWVHSVDRLKIAQRLSDQRPSGRAPLQVCVQINISGEASKSGAAPEDASELVRSVALLPGLALRGLMSIPAPDPDSARRSAAFRRLRGIHDALIDAGLPLDTLSMGMSDDLEDAIAEGATLVRVGSAIFGERPPRGTESPGGEFDSGLS